jgi:histidine ammonia-lyase
VALAGVAGAKAGRAAPCVIGRDPLSIADVLSLARGHRRPVLDDDPSYRARIRSSREHLEKAVASGAPVYGVTTGVGASVGNVIPAEHRDAMPHNLFRFHGCGTGRILDEESAAAIVAVRLVTLARGHSGVREAVLERLCEILEHRLLPRFPEEGSVGASGDLTPLSYLAALLAGEREATLRGRVLPASDALAELGLRPLTLEMKESLSLMNGTSGMTGLAVVAFERASRLARLAAAITAAHVEVSHGNRQHFDERFFELKPHPGQILAARWIRDAFGGAPAPRPARLQDRYSIRCAPHVIGVLVDALRQAEDVLEIEINGVDDNPIVDDETGEIFHGGHFYGGHVCFVMDGIKNAVANVADLLDRQLVLLCSPDQSDGLPANLVAPSPASDGSTVTHHGFKAMQISASALAAEALKLAVPASLFSRSTESHNQDKVSMGMIAARDCLRILELAETVAAIGLLAVAQAMDLRAEERPSGPNRALRRAVREVIPMLDADRRQDLDIARILEVLRSGALPIGDADA